MSGSTQKAKKPRTKTSKSRPPATSIISQPIVEDTRSSTFLSSFSPDARLLAFISLAVDKHRLRVFDVNTSQVVAEHSTNRTRITSLAWLSNGFADGGVQDEKSSPLKKRKKVDTTLDGTSKSTHSPVDVRVLTLGLSDGSVQIFSVTQGRIVKVLSHATRKSAVLAIAEGDSLEGSEGSLWTSSSDGALCMWDLRSAEIILQDTTQTPYTALAVRTGAKNGRIRILAANNTIHLLASSMDSASSDDSDSEGVVEICTFSGHASAVKSLLWDPSSSRSKRFFSSAEDDRFVYVWETPDTPATRGKLAASCPLDADVRQIDLCFMSGKQILLTLSSSGKLTIYPVPEELDASTGTKNSGKHQVPTLLPRSTINLAKKVTSNVHIAAATFLRDDPSKIRMTLVIGGVRMAFETLQYLDSTGEYISEITLKPSPSAFELAQSTAGTSIVNKRYSESTHISVASGTGTPHDSALDAIADGEMEGVLDADLAELSLGERLAARSDAVEGGGAGREQRFSGSDVEEEHAPGLSSQRRQVKRESVPAHSLTRTLIQALHAGDASLLEACLSHSDEALIRNTVVRLPSQLAVPLVNACVERLGRGARGNSIKGHGGGASAQRGMALIKWVRAVLTIHSGSLMTMPDLIARLSHLHSTLTTRLALQDRLLSLSGRLDLVLSQVELRSSSAPAPLLPQKQKNKKRGRTRKEPMKYIEGESSEDDEENLQVETEGDDEEGSIEDVELGVDIEDDSEDDADDGSDEDEDDEDEGNLVNGFLDDEAEEDYEDDESEEDSD